LSGAGPACQSKSVGRIPHLFRVHLAQIHAKACGVHHNLNDKIMENTNEFAQYQVAEVQLVYKSKVKPSQRPRITSSKDAQRIFLSTWDDTKLELAEQFKVMLLNRAHKVLGIFELSSGGISGTVADPKLIFAAALKGVASGIILAHNHPSGNLQPSQSDIDLTRKLKEAGRFLEIQVLDHVILTTEGYYSFADEGLI
jgi:DNA repair protein RadC